MGWLLRVGLLRMGVGLLRVGVGQPGEREAHTRLVLRLLHVLYVCLSVCWS